MAELDDEDAGCDDPAVHFYGAVQNADVATAEIALGYGMLGQSDHIINSYLFVPTTVEGDVNGA